MTTRLSGIRYGLCDPLDVGERDVLKDVELPVCRGDVGVQHFRVRQDSGLLLHGFAAEDVVARELVLGALQLPLGDPLRLHLVELGDQRLLHRGRGLAGIDDRDRIEQVRVLDQVGLAECGERLPRFVDELLIDPRAVAVG